ncbi:MAG: Rrf2 family transcriptional regulator [Candidatus Dasytiphilus stammeri]
MKLTSKGRYAVTAILDIALNSHRGPVSLTDISKRQGISIFYLQQLLARLRKKGLVSSIRGPGGGYLLVKEVNEIAVSSIIRAVDESVDATKCQGKESCHNGKRCLTHTLWHHLSELINEFLNKITLAELVKNNLRFSISNSQAVRESVTLKVSKINKFKSS